MPVSWQTHRLELVKRLQTALAGLGLVGRVGRVILRARGDRVDDGGNKVVVTAAAEEAGVLAGRLVLRGELGGVARQADFVEARRDVQVAAQADLLGDAREQALDRVGADRREHLRHVFGGVGNEHDSALKRKRPPRRTPEAERDLSSRKALTETARAGSHSVRARSVSEVLIPEKPHFVRARSVSEVSSGRSLAHASGSDGMLMHFLA